MPALDLGLLLLACASVLGLVLLGMTWHASTGPDQAPRHPIRKRILDLVHRRPGTRLDELWRALDGNRATVQYHLMILERVGALRSVRSQQTSRFFPSHLTPEETRQLTILLRGRVLEVAEAIIEGPGMVQNEITDQLDISRKVFRAYADLMVEADLLEEKRVRRNKKYFPTPALERLIAAMEDSEARDKQHQGRGFSEEKL